MHVAKIVIKKDPDNSKAVDIIMEGCLDINQAEMIRNKLLQSLAKYNEINVKIQNVDKIDIAFIQIFYSFLASAQNRQISVRFTAELSPEHKELLDRSGIDTGPFFNNL